MQQGRSRISPIVVMAVVVVGLLADGVLVIVKYLRDRPRREVEALQAQTNALTKGALLYAQSHQERLPAADRWKEQLVPYVEKQYLLDTRHIAMNRALSERPFGEIKSPMSAILFFEAMHTPDAEVEALPLRAEAGVFAVSFVNGQGSPRAISARDSLIRYSKEATFFQH